MSKMCCGITYSDDETVCKVCGKTLPENSHDLNDLLEDIKKNELAGDNKIEDSELEDDKLEDNKTDDSFGTDVDDYDENDLDEEVTDVLKSNINTEPEQPEEDLDSEVTDVLKRDTHRTIEDEKKAAALKEVLDNKINTDDDDDDKASFGLKFLGVISLLLAIAGLAIIGLAVYFLRVKPVYDKSNEDLDLNYQYIATSTDGITTTYDIATPGEEGQQ